MSENIIKIFDEIFENHIKLSKAENVLIITDNKDFADNVSYSCKKCGSVSTVIYIPPSIRPIKKLNKSLDKILGEFSVILLLVARRTDETNFRSMIMEKYEKGPRILYMAGLDQNNILKYKDAILTNPQSMKPLGDVISFVLSRSKKIQIETNGGNILEINTNGWAQKAGAQYGLIDERQVLDNLPSGKVFIHPISESINGKISINLSIPEYCLDNNVVLEFRNGILKNVHGKKEAVYLKEIIKKTEDETENEERKQNIRKICEFGIGLNRNAKVCGIQIIDDKVYGTAHIAIGHSKIVGGKFEAPIHFDFVFNNAKIKVDDEIIIENGEFILDNIEKLASVSQGTLISKLSENKSIKRKNVLLMCTISDQRLYINWEDASHRERKNLIGNSEIAALAAIIYNELNYSEFKKIKDLSVYNNENFEKVMNTLNIMKDFGILEIQN